MTNNFKINTIDRKFTCTSLLDEDGDFREVDNVDLAIELLFNLLTIRRGTYHKDPNLGSIFHTYLQEKIDNELLEDIKREIYNITRLYLSDYLSIENVEVLALNENTNLVFQMNVNVNNTLRKIEIGISNTKTYYKSLLEY